MLAVVVYLCFGAIHAGEALPPVDGAVAGTGSAAVGVAYDVAAITTRDAANPVRGTSAMPSRARPRSARTDTPAGNARAVAAVRARTPTSSQPTPPPPETDAPILTVDPLRLPPLPDAELAELPLPPLPLFSDVGNAESPLP